MPTAPAGLSIVGAVPVLAWLILAGQAAAFAWRQWQDTQAADVSPQVVYAAAYGALAYAAWRSSRWPVLAAWFYFVANTVSLAAGWRPFTPEFVVSTVLFGLIVAIGIELWPSAHWGVAQRPGALVADERSHRSRLIDFLSDVPLTVILAGLGLLAISSIWSLSVIGRFAFAADARAVTVALLAVPALGLAGGTIVSALIRLSRVAALATIAFPALYVAGNGGVTLGAFTAAAPASLLFATLLLPHWGRMTWRLSGYESLPRAVAQAFS